MRSIADHRKTRRGINLFFISYIVFLNVFIRTKIRIARKILLLRYRLRCLYDSRAVRSVRRFFVNFPSGAATLLAFLAFCAKECGKRVLGSLFLLSDRLKSKTAELLAALWTKAKENRVFTALLVCTAASFAFTLCFWHISLQVTVDGQVLGSIKDEGEFAQILRAVEKKAAVYIARPYAVNSDIKYTWSVFGNVEHVDAEYAEDLLFSKIEDISVCYVLRVDDKVVAASKNREEINGVLNGIVDEYDRRYDGSSLKITQKISISEEPVSIAYLMSADKIKQVLTEETPSSVDYTIKKGDTLSALALKFGTSVDSITAINPDIKPNHLQVGQTLVTSKAVPLITVTETAQITYSEEIPFDTVKKENSSMYTNEKKVLTKGKNGEKQIVADVVLVDGDESSRSIVSETVVSEAVSQVEYVGTKKPPAKSPTGKFRRPYGGYISSNYGYRHGEFHTGVDFAGPLGSTIVAADGGTVTFAGNNGNYGKCVIISHGNNLQTLYAHCSSLLVKKGDKVAKGESIAKVGATGRATGPHVHFEVRINGKHVNPWNYIS